MFFPLHGMPVRVFDHLQNLYSTLKTPPLRLKVHLLPPVCHYCPCYYSICRINDSCLSFLFPSRLWHPYVKGIFRSILSVWCLKCLFSMNERRLSEMMWCCITKDYWRLKIYSFIDWLVASTAQLLLLGYHPQWYLNNKIYLI